MEGRDKDHLVALKVMRLTKPSLMNSHPLTCDTRDLPGDTLHDLLQNDVSISPGIEHFGLSDLLTLPQNFGNIFLGETFSSYISVHNDSSQTCKEILLKADLQTSSQRISLSSTNMPTNSELEPDESVDDVIKHEVKELGTHILVCAVSYTSQAGEKLYFRKFFKFQVLKPLDVKTKFYNAESEEVYLEAQIQNITPGPIFMERVALDPSQQYDMIELNSAGDKDREKNIFNNASYLNSQDIRQYLYCLTPKSEMFADPKLLKGVTNIGKLDIVWKTNMGEKGRLQTSQLQRVALGYGDVRLTVEKVPDVAPIEKTFNISCRLTNCSERTMDLMLTLNNSDTGGLLWCGISGRQLGTLGSNEHTVLNLTILPVSLGLQTICGLRLTDTFLKRTYEHDEVAQVFVYGNDE